MAGEITEYTLGEEPLAQEPWQAHDWSTMELAFVADYLTHRNPTRAWRKAAGEDGKEASSVTARNRAMNMLAKPHVQSYITHVQAEMQRRLTITRETVLTELAKLAFANLADFIVISENGMAVTDLSGLTHEQLAALSEVTVETYMDGKGEDAVAVKQVRFKLAPKVAALELLGKSMKLWTDVVDDGTADIAEELRRARMERRGRLIEGETADGNDGNGNGEVSGDDISSGD